MSLSKILKVLLGILVIGLIGWFAYQKLPMNQQGTKPKVIGVVYIRQHQDAYEGLKEGIKNLGYTDKDVVYNEVLVVTGPNLYDDLGNGVRKLIADKVDVMFLSYEMTAKLGVDISKELGSTIPIVFMSRFHDPIDYGMAASYKSSGNNSTGVATNLIASIQKTLKFFKEINPEAKRIGVFSEGFMIPGGSDQILKELRDQVPRFGLTLVEYTTQKPPSPERGNFDEVASTIKPGDIDAIFHLPVHFYDPQEVDETVLANKLQIPMSVPSEDMPTGGNFSFADDFHKSAQQASVMIQKIFNGTQPKDIPIEFGSKSLLILNTKRAEEAGITFPKSMLGIAQVKIDK